MSVSQYAIMRYSNIASMSESVISKTIDKVSVSTTFAQSRSRYPPNYLVSRVSVGENAKYKYINMQVCKEDLKTHIFVD